MTALRHGTIYSYQTRKCRCAVCKSANTARKKAQREARGGYPDLRDSHNATWRLEDLKFLLDNTTLDIHAITDRLGINTNSALHRLRRLGHTDLHERLLARQPGLRPASTVTPLFPGAPELPQALCGTYPEDDMWFYTDKDSVFLAKTICRRCPERLNCLQHAIDNNEQHGVWGGLTPEQRQDFTRWDTA